MGVRRAGLMRVLAMGGVLLGCGREPAPEPAAESAGPPPATARTAEQGSLAPDSPEVTRQIGTPAAVAGESTSAAPAGAPGVAPPAPTVDALAQAVAGAAEAAAGASAGGGSNCEQAYGGVLAMVQALQQQLGGGSGSLPERETFVAACNELPENVQRCMVMTYAAQHREECQRATASVDEDTRARIRRMMGGGSVTAVQRAAP